MAKLCHQFFGAGFCKFGDRCRFSHSHSEFGSTSKRFLNTQHKKRFPESQRHDDSFFQHFPRVWKQKEDTHRASSSLSYANNLKKGDEPQSSIKFIFMTYNILADFLCMDQPKQMYPRAPYACLTWNNRLRIILAQIEKLRPDVICLQEVEFWEDVRRGLVPLGYDGRHVHRTGDRLDGCATLWLKSKFECKWQRDVLMQAHDLRDNVALLLELRVKLPKARKPKRCPQAAAGAAIEDTDTDAIVVAPAEASASVTLRDGGSGAGRFPVTHARAAATAQLCTTLTATATMGNTACVSYAYSRTDASCWVSSDDGSAIVKTRSRNERGSAFVDDGFLEDHGVDAGSGARQRGKRHFPKDRPDDPRAPKRVSWTSSCNSWNTAAAMASLDMDPTEAGAAAVSGKENTSVVVSNLVDGKMGLQELLTMNNVRIPGEESLGKSAMRSCMSDAGTLKGPLRDASSSSAPLPNLLVVNTHVLFNPKRGHVKLGQLNVILEAMETKVKAAAAAGGPSLAILFAGDFNMEPQSYLYRYLEAPPGEAFRVVPEKYFSGQAFGCDYRELWRAAKSMAADAARSPQVPMPGPSTPWTPVTALPLTAAPPSVLTPHPQTQLTAFPPGGGFGGHGVFPPSHDHYRRDVAAQWDSSVGATGIVAPITSADASANPLRMTPGHSPHTLSTSLPFHPELRVPPPLHHPQPAEGREKAVLNNVQHSGGGQGSRGGFSCSPYWPSGFAHSPYGPPDASLNLELEFPHHSNVSSHLTAPAPPATVVYSRQQRVPSTSQQTGFSQQASKCSEAVGKNGYHDLPPQSTVHNYPGWGNNSYTMPCKAIDLTNAQGFISHCSPSLPGQGREYDEEGRKSASYFLNDVLRMTAANTAAQTSLLMAPADRAPNCRAAKMEAPEQPPRGYAHGRRQTQGESEGSVPVENQHNQRKHLYWTSDCNSHVVRTDEGSRPYDSASLGPQGSAQLSFPSVPARDLAWEGELMTRQSNVVLRSAYKAVGGEEPLYTTYHETHAGAVDYVWYSPHIDAEVLHPPAEPVKPAGGGVVGGAAPAPAEGVDPLRDPHPDPPASRAATRSPQFVLEPVRALEPPDIQYFPKALPCPGWPSDHVSLVLEFVLRRVEEDERLAS